MIQEIIEAISIALNAEFGDGYTNYTEEVEQGLKTPCFFITCVNPSIRPFPSKRYLAHHLFCIQYIPSDGSSGTKAECNNVGERLESCLEYIGGDDSPIRGTEMHFEVTDGILDFFVNYDLFVRKIVDKSPEMRELRRSISVKKNERNNKL